ncbi:MAG: hypothetical protein Q7T30_00335, partial [Planctomycetota bacterium]|nr:hypothetical protein [Planctomycetota bacterium]
LALIVGALAVHRPADALAAERPPTDARHEYAIIRWDGRENSHIIRPDGSVLHVGEQLKDLVRPPRVHERAFYMASILNAMARDGYELAAMHPDEFIVRRLVPPLAPVPVPVPVPAPTAR